MQSGLHVLINCSVVLIYKYSMNDCQYVSHQLNTIEYKQPPLRIDIANLSLVIT